MKDWLFLWLQSEDSVAYTIDNLFDTCAYVFSDAVLQKMQEMNRARSTVVIQWEIHRRQLEADLEAERNEQAMLEREILEKEEQEANQRQQKLEDWRTKNNPPTHYKRSQTKRDE